jgi:opacity protein-like surface antigen
MKRPFFFLVLPLLVVASASPALAAENEAPKTSPPSDAHLRGVEIALRPTMGGVGGDSPVTIADSDAPMALRAGSSAFKWAAGVGAQIGWRFHPFVSAGFRFDLSRVSAETPNDGTKDLARETMGAGLYTRIYPFAMNESVRRHVDPWLGVGVGYARDVVSFSMPDKSRSVDIEAQRHAIAVPIGVGIDYRATEWLSVGPSFEYVLMNPIAGCVKASAGAASEQVCTDNANGKLVASSIGAWNAGIMLRVTPF